MSIMISTRSSYIPTIALGFLLTLGASLAAERKDWVTLTNCQYVTNKTGDGDSFRFRNGTNEYNLRLYFVDTPETNLRYADRNREQAEHFGITIDETIKAGERARDFTREVLQEPFVVRTRWANAGGSLRYYAFVEVGTNNLAAMLVSNGWARTKGVTAALPGQKSKDFSEKLAALEAEARQKRLGIWAMATKLEPQVK